MCSWVDSCTHAYVGCFQESRPGWTADVVELQVDTVRMAAQPDPLCHVRGGLLLNSHISCVQRGIPRHSGAKKSRATKSKKLKKQKA